MGRYRWNTLVPNLGDKRIGVQIQAAMAEHLGGNEVRLFVCFPCEVL